MGLFSLVLAANEQHHVEECPEQKPPRHGDQKALPLAYVRDGLLRQHVSAGGDAGASRHVGSQRIADGVQHLELHGLREVPDRAAIEHLDAA